MKLARTVLFGAVSLALAAGSAFAAGTKKSRFDRLDANNDGVITRAEAAGSATVLKNFDRADKNHDGYITRAEARGNPHLAKNFKAADRNNDGKLNRAEYLAAMTKKDLNTAKASTGATAPPQ